MVKHLLRIGLVALVYFLLAHASLLFEFKATNATPVWPASGFAFAMILIFGYRIAPGIALGAFAANLELLFAREHSSPITPIFLSMCIAIGNAGEAVSGYFLLKNMISGLDYKTLFNRTKNIFLFCVTVLMMCIVSAAVGTTVLYVAGHLTREIYQQAYVTWWFGDVAGIILYTPLILLWINAFQQNEWKNLRLVETLFFFLAAIVVTGVVTNTWFSPGFLFSRSFWIIPVMLWGALRLHKREVVTAVAISSIIAFFGTLNGKGFYVAPSINDSLLTSQVFVSLITVIVLIISAFLDEERKAKNAISQAHYLLEQRVGDRTIALAASNQNLQRQKEFGETLLDSSVDLIMSYDKEMRFLSFNKKCEELYGIKKEDVIGKNIFEFFPKAKTTSTYHDFITALSGIPVHNHNHESFVTTGRHYENYLIPLKDADNEVYGVLVIAHDITENVSATENLRKLNHELEEQKNFGEFLIDSNPSLVLALDKNFRITAWNKQSAKHTELEKAEVIGKSVSDFFVEYKNEKWITTFHQVLEGESFYFPKVKYTRGAGWGEISLAPIKNLQGEVIGILSTTRDITELVKAAEALEEKNKELEKKNEELVAFTYIASHDLQEPLRKIQTFAKIIIENDASTLSEKGKDYFSRIQNGAKRMRQLIEDLLNYSRTSTDKKYFEKIDLNILLAQVKEELKEKIIESGAVIESASLPQLYIIPFQFKQLLINLINNSIKFSKPGVAPIINIEGRMIDSLEINNGKETEEGKYFHLSVTDNGVGFNPEYNNLVFGLFQRLHGRHEYDGTGIGLAICKKIVENHYGVISAEGKPGKGATFNIYLPLTIAANDQRTELLEVEI